MFRPIPVILAAALVGAVLVSAALSDDNVDYWLKHATTASKPATGPGGTGDNTGKNPTTASAEKRPSRPDALPGAIELSDGTILAGFMYTTAEKDWEVMVQEDKIMIVHHVPFIAVLSIAANVEEEATELEWRWKEMGTPERVYTGRSYPTRRLNWTFKLIDGTAVTGAIKGQPIWIEQVSGKSDPMILAERTKGEMGQKLSDLVYIKHLVVSRRMMESLEKRQEAEGRRQ
jgi:hypothetical protein